MLFMVFNIFIGYPKQYCWIFRSVIPKTLSSKHASLNNAVSPELSLVSLYAIHVYKTMQNVMVVGVYNQGHCLDYIKVKRKNRKSVQTIARL